MLTASIFCLTLKVLEVVFVGAGEASHGAVVELLEEAQVLGAGQQPLPRGPHQEQVGVLLLLGAVPGAQLLHLQLGAWDQRGGGGGGGYHKGELRPLQR